MSIQGLLQVLGMLLYPTLEKRLGLYRLYAWSMVMWVLTGLGYPVLNLWARANGSMDGFVFGALMVIWLTIVS
jgi:Na+/melibiose symporter-like transporter